MKLSQIGLASSLFLSWFSFSSFANTASQDLLFSDPQKASMKFGTESIEYKDITSKELKAKKVIGVQVNLLKFKADLIESDPTEAKKQGSRTKLRTIYFPAFDSKGRINYWFIPDPGC